jgi:hypothetical protein
VNDEYAQGHRLWRETYTCGHTLLVRTFIGDFDFARAHAGLPAFCRECDQLVGWDSAVEIPPEEWDTVEEEESRLEVQVQLDEP